MTPSSYACPLLFKAALFSSINRFTSSNVTDGFLSSHIACKKFTNSRLISHAKTANTLIRSTGEALLINPYNATGIITIGGSTNNISNRLKLIADILQIFIVKFFDKDKEIFDAMRTLNDKLKKAEEINI